MSNLRGYRLNARLSAEALSELSGVPVRSIYNIEAGRVSRPGVTNLSALADALTKALPGVTVQPTDIDPASVNAERDAA